MNKDRTRERTIEQAEADAQAMVDELERLVEQLRLARAETSAGAALDAADFSEADVPSVIEPREAPVGEAYSGGVVGGAGWAAADGAVAGDALPSQAYPGEVVASEAYPVASLPGAWLPDEAHLVTSLSGNAAADEWPPGGAHPLKSMPSDAAAHEWRPGDAHPLKSMPDEATADEWRPGDAHPGEAVPDVAHPVASLPSEAHQLKSMPDDAAADEWLPGDAHPLKSVPGDAAANEWLPGDAHPGEAVPDVAHPVASLPGDAAANEWRPSDAHQLKSVPDDAAASEWLPDEAAADEWLAGEAYPGKVVAGEWLLDSAHPVASLTCEPAADGWLSGEAVADGSSAHVLDARIRTFAGVGGALFSASSAAPAEFPARPSSPAGSPPCASARGHRRLLTAPSPWTRVGPRRGRFAPMLGLAAVALVGIVGAAAVTAVRNAAGTEGGGGMEPIPYARTASGVSGSAAGAARGLLDSASPRVGTDAAPGPRATSDPSGALGAAADKADRDGPADTDDQAEGGGAGLRNPPSPQNRSAPLPGLGSDGGRSPSLSLDQALKRAEEAEAKELQALAQNFVPTGPLPQLPAYGGQRHAR